MKTCMQTLRNSAGWMLALATVLATSGLRAADDEKQPGQTKEVRTIVIGGGSGGGAGAGHAMSASGGFGGGGMVGAASGPGGLAITTIEPTPRHERIARKDQSWLGVAIEEGSEALASQLGLEPGAGLVVTYVAPDSPAAKAGWEKNDVLAELDGQLLVVPEQFRKLIVVHKQGDTVKLVLYRAGKKQTVSATLGKPPAGYSMLEGGHALDGESGHFTLPFGPEEVGQQMRTLRRSLGNVKIDTEKVQEEVRRSMEQARKAWQDAMRATSNVNIAPAVKVLKELYKSGIDVDNNASVTVRSTGHRVKSIVKADESGTIVVVCNPKPHLTAHDKDGKLLFDGEIDTPEEREKVPSDLMEKVKPLLEKVAPDAEEELEADPDASEGTSLNVPPPVPMPPSREPTL